MVKQPFTVFKENIAKARELMRLAELKEITTAFDGVLQPLKERKRISVLRRPFGTFPFLRDIRQLIKEKSDRIYEIALPQILVSAIASLDAYLRNEYHRLNPSDKNDSKSQSGMLVVM